MKLIELSQDRVTIVDDEDFDWLSKWKWHYARRKKSGYAERGDCSGPKQKTISMHVAIMKRHKKWKRGREVDHINTCGCDNRKVNLRLATPGEQGVNIGRRSNNTSGVTGVYWSKASGKWRAYIWVNGKEKHLGYYEDFDEAVEVRLKAEFKYYGEFQHDPTNVCPLGHTGQCPECAARLKERQCL